MPPTQIMRIRNGEYISGLCCILDGPSGYFRRILGYWLDEESPTQRGTDSSPPKTGLLNPSSHQSILGRSVAAGSRKARVGLIC
eukprot:12258615-Heterocapsa_arctica.AAC.1